MPCERSSFPLTNVGLNPPSLNESRISSYVGLPRKQAQHQKRLLPMSKPGKSAGPPSFEDSPRFYEREWLIQRIGWTVLVLFLLVGAAGLLGKGPMAHDSIALPSGTLGFERFARRHAPTEWVIDYSTAPSGGSFEFAISSAYLSKFEVKAITPEPEKTEMKAGEVSFTFAAQSDGRVVFHLDPQTMGIARGTIRIDDAAAIPLRQVIYP